MSEGSPSSNRRPLVLLALGIALGALMAAAGLLVADDRDAALPGDAAARVNGELIRRDDYDRLLAALAGDRRNPIDDAQRQLVLDRLIEEELLIQRGLELGLAQLDTRVRKDLTMAMIDSVVADVRDLTPTDDELQAFYAENASSFAQAGRYRVRQIWCRAATLADGDAAYRRARDAGDRWRAGEAYETVKAELGDEEISPIPDSLLPPTKLTDYLGPTALRTVLELQPGQVSEPIRSSTGYHVLQLVERGAATVPDFESVREQVAAEFRRRRADDALRSYLDDLRARAEVEVAEDLR